MAPADLWKRAQFDDPFWAEQRSGLSQPHVAPINTLLDQLSIRKGSPQLPYAAPWHGGISAQVLCVLNDPGEATGMPEIFCARNPDRTADRLRHLMSVSGVSPEHLSFWNGYPWPRETKKDLLPAEALEGGEALLQMLDLMSDLRLLLLLGRKARDAADTVIPQLAQRYPDLQIIRSLHPLGAKSTVHRNEQKDLWAHVSSFTAQVTSDLKPTPYCS